MLQEAVRSHQSSLGVGRLQSCQFEAILIQELHEQTFGQRRGDTTGLGQPCRYDISCTLTWTPSMRPSSSSTIRACAGSRLLWAEARRGEGWSRRRPTRLGVMACGRRCRCGPRSSGVQNWFGWTRASDGTLRSPAKVMSDLQGHHPAGRAAFNGRGVYGCHRVRDA